MARRKSGKATVTAAGIGSQRKKLARLPMTNPRGKLFAKASFCAHAAPVIAGAYRPLHARWREREGAEGKGRKKDLVAGGGGVSVAVEKLLFSRWTMKRPGKKRTSLEVHPSFLSPESVIRCETSGSSRCQDNREAIAWILEF